MKQIIRCLIDGRGKVRLTEVPAPRCSRNEILVENECSLISLGTETKMAGVDTISAAMTTYKDEKLRNTVITMFRSMKLTDFLRTIKEELQKGYPMGYSGSGKVIEIGADVKGVNVGDRVSYGGLGHSELVKVPQNLFIKLPKNVTATEGAFVTLGSICMQGVRQSRLGYGEFVVVYGLGLLGLITVQILNAYGFKVIALDIDDHKIQKALKFGAIAAYNVQTAGKDQVTQKIFDTTNGQGADGVIICASDPKDDGIINHSAVLTRKKGRLVIVGNVGMGMERGEFYRKELELTIACSYGPGRYDPSYEQKGIDYPFAYVRWTEKRNMEEFAHLISTGKINIIDFISDEISINTSESAYARIRKDSDYNPIGVIIKYDIEKSLSRTFHLMEKQVRSKKELNVGVIGSGNYARTSIMPILSKSKSLKFYSLCSSKGEVIKQFGDQYKLNCITTEYRTIIEDENVDVVHIATRHDSHQKIAVEALKNGKIVITEKPSAMSLKELNELMDVIRETQGNYHVCYNRRYSPFAVKAKLLIAAEKSIIKISVNTKKLKSDSWIADSEAGGGRVIGESCHFFDLLGYLIQSTPVSLYATNVNGETESIISNNNFIVTLNYLNGSIGQISYSDYGSQSYPKEMIEINGNNVVIRIADFKEMRVYGKKEYRTTLKMPDKGHTEFFNQISNYLTGKQSQNVPEPVEYYHSALLPLKAIESISTGSIIRL